MAVGPPVAQRSGGKDTPSRHGSIKNVIRGEGKKQPTAAHRAISALAAQGYVRVIITTNFDRLIENALREAGVEPTVLSTPDQVHGALPLIHTTYACVIKLQRRLPRHSHTKYALGVAILHRLSSIASSTGFLMSSV